MPPNTEPSAPPSRELASDTSDAAIGRRIREAREAKNLTQQQVSVRSKWVDHEEKGISRTALIGYEAGTSRPGTRELRIICETLYVSPNHLLFGSEHPFQTAHAGAEMLRGKRRQLVKALQVAFVVMALKEHEKDALLSLAMSLGGHHLGDVRLAGLRGMAGLVAPEALATIRGAFGDMEDAEFDGLPLNELAQRLSRELRINIGTKLRFDDEGEVVGGEQTYPDPEE
ncbi:MAG: helix-turn-helix domain-containing protein [Roseateles sp.]|uniref:helix-turn-helix domain-containing protein n=1 Tax=Roseateles sp. TaxID=1971397 RepID=UPI00403570EC